MPPFGEQVSGHLLVLSSLGSVSPAFGCILHVVCSITTSSQTWHVMPQLYLPLPPSLLLPFWLFYFFLLRSCAFFFFLLCLSFLLWFSKGRSAPAQPGKLKIITKAQVGFFCSFSSTRP